MYTTSTTEYRIINFYINLPKSRSAQTIVQKNINCIYTITMPHLQIIEDTDPGRDRL